MRSSDWQTMTSGDVHHAEDRSNWIVLLPLGATEQHGLHLPLGTDTVIVEGVVAAALPHVEPSLALKILPTLSYGLSPEHSSFAGTITFSAETMLSILREIGQSLSQSGIKRIVFANGHGGNVPILDLIVQELRQKYQMLAVHASLHRLGEPDDLFEGGLPPYDVHGGAIETSLMMALQPDMVRNDHLANYPSKSAQIAHTMDVLRMGRPVGFGWMAQDMHPSGVQGNATLATAQSGQALLDYRAKRLALLLNDVARFDLAVFSPAS
jgi:creatinine amidohydrolase